MPQSPACSALRNRSSDKLRRCLSVGPAVGACVRPTCVRAVACVECVRAAGGATLRSSEQARALASPLSATIGRHLLLTFSSKYNI